MPTKSRVLCLFAAVDVGCAGRGRRWRRGDGAGGAGGAEGAGGAGGAGGADGAGSWEKLNFWKKGKKNKKHIFTSHQPKLCVWLCVHIHAQICMFTLHSQGVKYSMCVQIHWSVCVCVVIVWAPPQRKEWNRFVSFDHNSSCEPVDVHFFVSVLVQMTSPPLDPIRPPCPLSLFTVTSCCCCRKQTNKKNVTLTICMFLLELNIYNLLWHLCSQQSDFTKFYNNWQRQWSYTVSRYLLLW